MKSHPSWQNGLSFLARSVIDRFYLTSKESVAESLKTGFLSKSSKVHPRNYGNKTYRELCQWAGVVIPGDGKKRSCALRIPDPPVTDDGFRITDLLDWVEAAVECSKGPDRHLVKWNGLGYIMGRFGPFEIRNWHKPFDNEAENAEEEYKRATDSINGLST